MRISGARIFLSLLAGKFSIFKQMLTGLNDRKIKNRRMRIERPYFVRGNFRNLNKLSEMK